jgi:hypothetical protein
MRYIHYADIHNGTVRTIEHWHKHYSSYGYMSFADCIINITPVTRGLWRWNMEKKGGKWNSIKRADNQDYVEIPVPDTIDIVLAVNVMASVALAIKLSSVLAAVAAITCAAALVSKCRCDLQREG